MAMAASVAFGQAGRATLALRCPNNRQVAQGDECHKG